MIFRHIFKITFFTSEENYFMRGIILYKSVVLMMMMTKMQKTYIYYKLISFIRKYKWNIWQLKKQQINEIQSFKKLFFLIQWLWSTKVYLTCCKCESNISISVFYSVFIPIYYYTTWKDHIVVYTINKTNFYFQLVYFIFSI